MPPVLRTERIAHLGTEETAALRDFNAAYDRSGSKTGCPRNVLGESASPQKTDINRRDFRGRLVPKAAVSNRSNAALFDHLVGGGEQRGRYF
jgi:hypothetical protein